jgi:hypothetical protein
MEPAHRTSQVAAIAAAAGGSCCAAQGKAAFGPVPVAVAVLPPGAVAHCRTAAFDHAHWAVRTLLQWQREQGACPFPLLSVCLKQKHGPRQDWKPLFPCVSCCCPPVSTRVEDRLLVAAAVDGQRKRLAWHAGRLLHCVGQRCVTQAPQCARPAGHMSQGSSTDTGGHRRRILIHSRRQLQDTLTQHSCCGLMQLQTAIQCLRPVGVCLQAAPWDAGHAADRRLLPTATAALTHAHTPWHHLLRHLPARHACWADLDMQPAGRLWRDLHRQLLEAVSILWQVVCHQCQIHLCLQRACRPGRPCAVCWPQSILSTCSSNTETRRGLVATDQGPGEPAAAICRGAV